MKFSPLIFLLLFSPASCSFSHKGDLTIKGNIKDASPGSRVYLEEVTYITRNAIDTAELDAKGNYSFSTKLKNLGLYQVRLGEKNSIFLVLDEKPQTIIVNADTAAIRNFSYTVKGSPSSEQLRKFIGETKRYGEAFGKAMNEYGKNVSDSTVDSIRQLYASKVMEADSNFRRYARGYVDTVKNPVIAIFAVTNLDFRHDRATYENLEARMKDYAQLPFVQAYLSMMNDQKQAKQEDMYAPKFKTGDIAPEIELKNPLGNPVKLSSLRGQVVLLDFWASWCGPCRKENPNVVAAYQKYKDRGFSIFSVSLDTDHDRWVKAIKQDHLDWTTHVSELKGWESIICAEYGVQSIPQSFLLDKNGKIIGMNLRGAGLEQILSQVLQ